MNYKVKYSLAALIASLMFVFILLVMASEFQLKEVSLENIFVFFLFFLLPLWLLFLYVEEKSKNKMFRLSCWFSWISELLYIIILIIFSRTEINDMLTVLQNKIAWWIAASLILLYIVSFLIAIVMFYRKGVVEK